MKVRILCFVLAMLFATTASAQRRAIFTSADRPEVVLCPADTLPKGYKVWTQAGVAPLLPEILGSGPEMVHMFFAADLTPEFLNVTEMTMLNRMTPTQRINLDLGRQAMRSVMAKYLFTPTGTLEQEATLKLPREFELAVSEAMRPENLELTIVTCGTVLYGMSSGTRIEVREGQPSLLKTVVEHDPIVAGWAEPGVVKDGKPGFRIWIPKKEKWVKLVGGHNDGSIVGPYVIAYCGNGGFDLMVSATTVTVEPLTTLPQEPTRFRFDSVEVPKPERKVILVPPVIRPDTGGFWCTRSKTKGVVCAAAAAAVVCGVACRGGNNGPAGAAANNSGIKRP
jgi:hypothetical protein